MDSRIQKASEEMVELLGDDGLEITWWTRPHRGGGWVKCLFVSVEDEEEGEVIVVGESQSLEHLCGVERLYVDDDLDHAMLDVDVAAIPPIFDLLTTTTLPWRRAAAPEGILGGSHFGIRVEWARSETERRWTGRVGDVDEVTARLWALIDPLVPSHGDLPGETGDASGDRTID